MIVSGNVVLRERGMGRGPPPMANTKESVKELHQGHSVVFSISIPRQAPASRSLVPQDQRKDIT